MKDSEPKSATPPPARDRANVRPSRARTDAFSRRGTCTRALGSRLRARIAASEDTASVEALPLPARFFPSASPLRPGMSLLLVTQVDGSRACLTALGRRALLRSPSLGGRRKALEDACLSLGAHLEIWTEDEIDQDLGIVQLVRPATAAERAAWNSAAPPGRGECAGGAQTLAFRMGITDLRPVGNGLVGIRSLTGIAVAFLCDLEVDPGTSMVVWRPRACPVGG